MADEYIKVMIVDDEPIIRKAIKYELNDRHEQVQCQMNDDGVVSTKEIVVLDTYANGPQLFAALNDPQHERPDYILCDMEFQGEPTGGIFITDRIRRQYKNASGKDIKVIILSGRFDNPLPNECDRHNRMMDVCKVIFESLRHGADAFVSKNAVGGFSIENIIRAIACLERGEKNYFNYPVMMSIKEAAELYVGDTRHFSLEEEFDETEREILVLEAAGCTAQEIAARMRTSAENDKSVQEKQKEMARKLNVVNKSGARIAKAIQYGLLDVRQVQYLKR